MKLETRTWLELSIGKTHLLQVLIHIRTSDLMWWNEQESLLTQQLLGILSRQIIPIECKEEIQTYHSRQSQQYVNGSSSSSAKKMKTKTSSKKKNDQNKKILHDHTQKRLQFIKDDASGGKNNSKQATKSNQDAVSKKAATNETGKTSKFTKGKSTSKPTKNKKESLQKKDEHYLFGDNIQVTYRVEPIETSHSTTLLFTTKNDYNSINAAGNGSNHQGIKITGDKEHTRTSKKRKRGKKPQTNDYCPDDYTPQRLSTFRSLIKLKKRIILWIFPWDPLNPDLDAIDDGGFPRHEMIPLSSLFSSK